MLGEIHPGFLCLVQQVEPPPIFYPCRLNIFQPGQYFKTHKSHRTLALVSQAQRMKVVLLAFLLATLAFAMKEQ